MTRWSSLPSPGERAKWGALGLGFLPPPPFFFTWALVLQFHRYLLSFGIMFTFDSWLCYRNRVFAYWMFLQREDT